LALADVSITTCNGMPRGRMMFPAAISQLAEMGRSETYTCIRSAWEGSLLPKTAHATILGAHR
jgi:hypothetical protein